MGQELARLDFPVRGARIFANVFFGIMAALMVVWFVRVMTTMSAFPGSHAPFFIVFGVYAATVLVGFLVTRRVVGRRPSAMIVADDGFIVQHSRRRAIYPWARVTGLDQRAVRGVPTHVVLLDGARPLPFGVGEKAQRFARALALQAGLTWDNEPFTAHRPAPEPVQLELEPTSPVQAPTSAAPPFEVSSPGIDQPDPPPGDPPATD